RSKQRFYGEPSYDKQAAFQTLYGVLLTLAKLFAPVMPFVTEAMYQNLVVGRAGVGPPSVHLCDYPTADESLIDQALSEDMAPLLRLKEMGSAARNAVKIKVRQPLAELKVQPANDADRRAVARFSDLLMAELNVKKVTLHDGSAGALLKPATAPNRRTLGPEVG